MRNTKLVLAFLILTFGYPIAYAHDMAYHASHSELNSVSITSNESESTKYDELETQIIIYSLIIGVYTLFWLKQKA
jgi:hypothetical protein